MELPEEGLRTEESREKSDPLRGAVSSGSVASLEGACMEKLLRADWGGRLGEPLTADELLVIGRGAFEDLLRNPPIGPVPEYLAFYGSVYGCVAEYEEKIEELDRWKAIQLNRWLNTKVGTIWCVAGRFYELQSVGQSDPTFEKFRINLLDGCREVSD